MGGGAVPGASAGQQELKMGYPLDTARHCFGGVRVDDENRGFRFSDHACCGFCMIWIKHGRWRSGGPDVQVARSNSRMRGRCSRPQ